jgi:methylated-DNA-[protein]-cysteine S-methyltransferase
MTAVSWALFETAIGACGLAWSARGVAGVNLPEASSVHTRARLARRFPGALEAPPPASVQAAMAAMTALLAGEKPDLREIKLDLSGVTPFHAEIYALARAIPPGETRSYGELARAAGQPNAARAVGQAMAKNPFPIVVPCHRVLAAGEAPGGFSARGGVATKMRMLAIEGWRPAAPDLFDLPA